MKILTVSGSARPSSSNILLLQTIALRIPQHEFVLYPALDQLPLFTAARDQTPFDSTIMDWRKAVQAADAIIICTPEYLHNLPALLKNALEWLTTSGELFKKRVLVMTFTPHPPRGEQAMQSLIWSLQALEANVVGQLDLYQTEVQVEDDKLVLSEEYDELLSAAIQVLVE